MRRDEVVGNVGPRYVLLFLGLITIFNIATVVVAADKYIVKDIGPLSSGGSVEGMNNNGQLVGALPAGATRFRGWWYDGAKIVDLNTCGGIGCRAMDINAQNQIVGNIGRDPYIYSHG